MLVCYNCYISICVFYYQYSCLDCFQIKMDQITKLVVLPLYPQFSISTSGSSLRILEEIFRYLFLAWTALFVDLILFALSSTLEKQLPCFAEKMNTSQICSIQLFHHGITVKDI